MQSHISLSSVEIIESTGETSSSACHDCVLFSLTDVKNRVISEMLACLDRKHARDIFSSSSLQDAFAEYLSSQGINISLGTRDRAFIEYMFSVSRKTGSVDFLKTLLINYYREHFGDLSAYVLITAILSIFSSLEYLSEIAGIVHLCSEKIQVNSELIFIDTTTSVYAHDLISERSRHELSAFYAMCKDLLEIKKNFLRH